MAETQAPTIGRPSDYDESIVLKLEEAFKVDSTVDQACAYAGIGRSTYYRWRDAYEDFRDRMDRAMEFPFLRAKQTVNVAIDKGDGRLAMDWLRARENTRYAPREKKDLDIKGKITLREAVERADEIEKAQKAKAAASSHENPQSNQTSHGTPAAAAPVTAGDAGAERA